jgi:glycosyltransferase involved in cell wall biosynthesis
MRITALVKSPEHVCCRYRVAAFRPYLEPAGHVLDIRGWPASWLGRALLYRQLRHTDALLIQRKLLPSWQLRLVRRRVRWLIFDYDDSIFLHNSYNPQGTHSAGRSSRFEETVRLADAVVAGNDFLRRQAASLTSPQRLHVIPTCVDVQRYPLALHAADKPRVELVWVGSSSTMQGLEQVRGLFEDLGKNLDRIQLKIVCDRSLTLERLPVVFRPWQEATEAAEIAGADIGISWLPADLWSDGKCGLKVLQYMAAGLPVVANPVGLNRTLVRHGETGFLATTPAEWLQAVRRLTLDPALRQRFGRAARAFVEASYQVPVGAAAWLRLLQHLQPSATRRAS